MIEVSRENRELAWVLFHVIFSTKRPEHSVDDVIEHAMRIIADYKNLSDGSRDRVSFETDIAMSILAKKQKIDEYTWLKIDC